MTKSTIPTNHLGQALLSLPVAVNRDLLMYGADSHAMTQLAAAIGQLRLCGVYLGTIDETDRETAERIARAADEHSDAPR